MIRHKILNTLRDIRNLPTLPNVVMEILRLCDDPNSNTREIAALIENDPVLTTKVLKLVNSSYFGLSKELYSVNQALVLIGYNQMKNLILSTSMLQMFKKDTQVGSFSRRELWKHSIGVGIATRFLSKRYRVENPEQAFVAGLIHDVGKVIIDWFFHEHFVKIIDLVEQESCWIREAEQRVMKVTHEDIGSYLTTRWHLPDLFRETIAYHHEPSRAREHQSLAAIVQVADNIIRQLKVGYGGDPTIPSLNGSLEEILSVEETVDDLLPCVQEELDNSGDLFTMFD
jgi:HD-like signal output (HDOD) protein